MQRIRDNSRAQNSLIYNSLSSGNSPVKWGKIHIIGESGLSLREGARYEGGVNDHMIKGLTSTAYQVKNHSKIKKNSLLGQFFLRLRRA